MFPVLVTLDNREGLLKPGMNGEVTVLVERREDVLSVPNDAVRQTREAAATAKLVGLDPDSVVAAVQEQMRAMGGGGSRGNGRLTGTAVAAAAAAWCHAATSRSPPVALQGGGQGGRQGFQMPEVTDAAVQAGDRTPSRRHRPRRRRCRDCVAACRAARSTSSGRARCPTRSTSRSASMRRWRAPASSVGDRAAAAAATRVADALRNPGGGSTQAATAAARTAAQRLDGAADAAAATTRPR